MAYYREDRIDHRRHDSARRILSNPGDAESLEKELKALKPIFAVTRMEAKHRSTFVDAGTVARLKSNRARRRGTRRTSKGKPSRAAASV
jgi:hypothetical protein